MFEKVDDFLEETASRFRRRGLDSRSLRLEGDVGDEILNAARDHDVDVIALGAFGQARTQDFLVGSVAEKVETLADRDVVLVRDTDLEAELRAVVAVDGSASSLDAARSFARLTRADRALVRVLHVFDVPPSIAVPPSYKERADEALETASSVLGELGVRAEAVTRLGPAAAGILDEAKEFEASLIALGSTGQGSALPWGIRSGTVRKRVARHASCSVLVATARRTREET